MELPNSAAGVPVLGIDPTVEELSAFANLSGAHDWVGTSEPFQVALASALGAPAAAALRFRDVVFISDERWAAAIAAMLLPRSPEGEEPGNQEPLSAFEHGQAVSLRRICRLRLGLTPRSDGLGDISEHTWRSKEFDDQVLTSVGEAEVVTLKR